MKILLFLGAAVLFAAPVPFYVYMIALGNAYGGNGRPLKIALGDFWSTDFLWIAIGPWAITAVLLFFALRR